MPFTFSKSIDLRAIRIRSQIYSYHASRLGGKGGEYDWFFSEKKDFLPDETIEIPIAFIPEAKGHPGVYGDKDLAGYMFSAMSAHFITIELLKKTAIQQKTLQIFMPGDRPSFDPPDKIESAGRYLIFEDKKLPEHNG